MIKDTAIWISINKLGFPLGKLFITPERASFYEVIGKSYFDGDFRLFDLSPRKYWLERDGVSIASGEFVQDAQQLFHGLGLLCGFVGVGLIVWPRGAMASGQVGWQALILIGSFSWAVGTILYRDASLGVGPVAFNAVMMLFGGSWLVLAGLGTGELPRWGWRPGGLLAMLYLAVFGSALAYTAYSWLLKRVPADRVGTFAYVNPAVATVLGWAILGESLGPLQVAGMVVVLLGVALVTLPSRLA